LASSITVLIPIFNDWEAAGPLLRHLDSALAGAGLGADVVVVDDGSTEAAGVDFGSGEFEALRSVSVLALRRNLGHQRAIAVGLAHLEARAPADYVVVMDGDGEDDPADVPRLLEEARRIGGDRIVFAARARRAESWSFRVLYQLYKILHYVLTGEQVRVGNFSVIPRARLASLVVVSEMWIHYAAAAFVSRQPRVTLETRRARRLRGRASMNYVQLVAHGLRAISVYRELVSVRILVGAAGMTALAMLGLAGAVLFARGSAEPLPESALALAGVAVLLLSQVVLSALFLTFVLLSERGGSLVLPARDYALFIHGVRTIVPRETPRAP
jgi:hypothetical protein